MCNIQVFMQCQTLKTNTQQVLSIRNYGAIVKLGKDSKEKAFIPGWSYRNSKISAIFLTTTQGVELSIQDLITFCVDPHQEKEGFDAVGCNVTVLKHASDKVNILAVILCMVFFEEFVKIHST